MAKLRIITTMQITEELDYSPEMYPGFETIQNAADFEYGLPFNEMMEGISQTLELAKDEKIVRIEKGMEFPTDVPADSVVYQRNVVVIPD